MNSFFIVLIILVIVLITISYAGFSAIRRISWSNVTATKEITTQLIRLQSTIDSSLNQQTELLRGIKFEQKDTLNQILELREELRSIERKLRVLPDENDLYRIQSIADDVAVLRTALASTYDRDKF